MYSYCSLWTDGSIRDGYKHVGIHYRVSQDGKSYLMGHVYEKIGD